MMTALTLVFFGLALAGALFGHLGVTILSLLMVAFMIYATKVFARQDAAWAADPRNAPAPRATQQILDEVGCECNGHRDQP